jgi:Carboxypeptidase regulatory-like domain/TonB-dependent Receptor Plug Domain
MIHSRICHGARSAGLAAGFLLYAVGALAGGIFGSVTGEEGTAPLVGVSVVVSGNGQFRDVRSDSDGKFEFVDLPSGLYRVEFTAFGYLDLVRDVELLTDQNLILDQILEPAPFELEELVVVGSASDNETDLQTGYVNLDAEFLDTVPAIVEPDPLRALQILPGVQAASDISSGLYIRGGGPDQTLVLMDGVTVYNPTHAFGFFSTFSNDVVDDVSLYKGAYPAAYGGRLAAVLDVNMKEADAEEFGGKAGVSIISARLFLEGKLGPDHWQISGRRSYLDPILDAAGTEDNPIPAYYFYDMNAAYATTRGGGRTIFQMYHGKDSIGVDADANTDFDIDWGNTVTMLRHERFLTDQLEGRFTVANSRYKSLTGAQILSTGLDVDNRLNDFSLSGLLRWQAAWEHRFDLGLAYTWYDFVYRQSFNRQLQIDYGAQPSELAFFLEDRWFIDDLTTLRTGLRYRYLDDGGRSLLEPRLSLSRAVRSDLRLKFGAGLYNQYLQLVATEGFSAGDFYLPVDESTDLGQSWQTVLGGDWDATERDQISLEVYATGLDHLVEMDSRATMDQSTLTAEDLFVTGGKGYARGLEVFLRHRGEGWNGWLGYTLGWTSRKFAELNDGQAFRPKYDRRHDINALVSRRVGRWKLASSFRYATGQSYTPAAARFQLGNPATGGVTVSPVVLSADRNSGRLLPYHRLDISARRPFSMWGRPAELVLEVFNLYSRRNEWFIQYDTDEVVTEASVVRQLPIIPSLGVSFDF